MTAINVNGLSSDNGNQWERVMKTEELSRFSKFGFRNGKTLRNRVVIPPMASETASDAGRVTEKTIRHYSSLAAAKAGLVTVEYTYVHVSGRSETHQLGIQSDAHVQGLREIVKVIHGAGALAGIQLTHAGGKTSRDLTGGVLMGPSQVSVPVKNQNLETPGAMSFEDIRLWKDSFVEAVRRAEEAGFDLVEFHVAHGYGLNQWLSPLTNQRQDSYGGSLANQAQLLFEIVERARALHPDLLFAVRMPGQDFLEGGLNLVDAVWIAKELERRGLDLLDVSSGIGGWRRPKDRVGEGYLVSDAEVIQAAVSIPVVGVGGIESGNFIDTALISKRLALAAVGRAVLKDPIGWGALHLKKESLK